MVVSDADFLQLKNQVENLKTEVGTDPSGIYPTVEDRVDAIASQVESLLDTTSIPLAGDLSGTSNNALVIGLQGRLIDATAPTDTQVLTWDEANSMWKPAAGGGGGAFTAGGDLSGSSSSQTIAKLQGTTLTLTPKVTGDFIRYNGTSWVSVGTDTIDMAGDVGGKVNNAIVNKIKGVTVSGVAPTTYQVLLYSGSQWEPTTLPNASVSDSGFIRLTGDLSGAYNAPTVVKANGATIPAAGSLTTGNILQVSGSSALSYGALNLAGGANYVTGILPAANHPDASTVAKGIVQLAGDLAGTSTSVTVSRINGSTVPAGGALTTGNGLYVTGVGALSYSALNLAGGANYVSGILPAANHPDATTGAKGIVQLAGDLAGTSTSVTVSRINGSTVPAGGSLTTGTVLRATGTATLAYGALDLANVSAVTGVLPSANLFQATTGTSGAVRLTGDLGGTGASPTVVDLTITSEANGSTIYFNGTNWVNRAAGTANYIFTANGAAAPTWNNSISAMTDVRSQIFSLDPVSGTAGNSRVLYDTFTTTSNTQYTARTISFAAGVSAVVTCCITGVDANTGGGGTNRVISITKSGKYYRAVAGSLQISGSSTVQDHTPTWGDNQTAIDLSFVVSSNDLQIKVTGQSTFNAKWSMETTVRLVLI